MVGRLKAQSFGCLVAASLLGLGAAAHAEDLVVLSSVAMKGPIVALTPGFEATGGAHVAASFDAAGALKTRIDGGARFCVAVLAKPAIEDLAARDRVVKATIAPIGHIGLGVAFAASTSHRSVATPEDLKVALLSAKAISVSDPALGGLSSAYFKSLTERLGIAQAIAPKLILTRPGEGAKPVAEGRAEIGIVTLSEIAGLSGIKAEPLFPDDPKTRAQFSAAVATDCPAPGLAKAYIAFLRRPEAAPAFTARNIAPD